MTTATADSIYRLMAIELQDGMAAPSPELSQEVKIAIHDLLGQNLFRPHGSPGGPYRLMLGTSDSRLVFDIRLEDFSEHGRLLLSLTPFRRVLREYQEVCRNYQTALHVGQLARLEAVDHGRRGLHNEGAELLIARLRGRIEIDFATARRLFTLVSALTMKANA